MIGPDRRTGPFSGPGLPLAPTGRSALILGLLTFGAPGAGTVPGAEPLWQTVVPPGVPRGGTVEVTLGGTDLKDVRDLVFSLPGVEARRRPDGRFAVAAEGDVPARDGDVWALTASGLSNPRRFAVDDLPGVAEREKNDGADSAQDVAPPVVIDGAINPATDRDDYDNSGRPIPILTDGRPIDELP